jgi:predicted porin
MKRIALSTLSLALLGATGVAHAQSSVTLYGLIDESVQYVHNANPANNNLWQLAAGNLQGSRWGLKGSEDLGGGLKAIFQLESGFNPNNGKMGSYGTGTKLFGRQAYVGLTQDAYGTLTLGRQYDPLVDLVQPLTGDNFFGSTFTTPGDVDNNDNSSRTNNAIKYVSPVWGGFQFEGMYALGGVAGATGAGQSWAGAATWSGGPFSVAAGYFRMQNANTLTSRGVAPGNQGGTWNAGVTSDGTFDGSNINGAYASAKQIDITSAAAQYVTGPFTFNVRYSFAQYKPDAFSGFTEQEKYHVAGAYAGYQLTPAMLHLHARRRRHVGELPPGFAGRRLLPVEAHRPVPRWRIPARKRSSARCSDRWHCQRRCIGWLVWLPGRFEQPGNHQPGHSPQVLNGLDGLLKLTQFETSHGRKPVAGFFSSVGFVVAGSG